MSRHISPLDIILLLPQEAKGCLNCIPVNNRLIVLVQGGLEFRVLAHLLQILVFPDL